MNPKREEKKQTSTGMQHHGDPYEDENAHGSLIAVEGDAEVIDTQLRLLPPSSKILILSSLKDGIPKRNGKVGARAFVRDVHAAFTARSATARAFLQSSTSSQPRLVFMNGGCVGARTACITHIAENITNGNVREAEEVLEGILRDGVEGLSQEDQENQVEKEEEEEYGIEEEDTKIPRRATDNHHQLEDPSSVAMRAAEDLDRETAELHPRIEHKIGGSAIVPIVAHLDGMSLPEYPQVSKVAQETILVAPSRSTSLNDKRSTFGHHSAYTANTVLTEIFSQDEKNWDSDSDAGDDCDKCSRAEELCSTAQTPAVEFGQACIIDVQSARPSLFGPKKSSSLDHLLDSRTYFNIRNRHESIKRTPSDTNISDRPTTSDGLPRLHTTFLKASETTIKRSPIRSPHSPKRFYGPNGRAYVDRGTDPIDFSEVEPVSRGPFQPVFPVIEDFIINFVYGNQNPIIESTIQSYKNGKYIPLPPSESESTPPSPHDSHFTFENTSEKVDSYDHLESHDTKRSSLDNKVLPQRYGSKIQNPGTTTAAPLTPASTPPPQKTGVAHKFLLFVPLDNLTPISVQNAFRVLLTAHFPPSATGFKQYAYASDLDRLWKPVFRFKDASGKESRTVDQIIAIGCEENVRKDFLGEIAGGIEKLGMKKNGLSRSGRLDIGYLIANAMQIYTNPHPSIVPSSPLSNPTYLATLLVPHLESYLAANPTTRLLVLQYPAAYLPVILSLRELLGAEILKIAGIIAHSKAASSPKSPRMPSNDGTTALNSRNRPLKQSSSPKDPCDAFFAAANFQLSDLATPSETDHFFSQIQRCLLEKSSFYMPEPPSPALQPLFAKSATKQAVNSDNERVGAHPASPTKQSESEGAPYTFLKSAKSGLLGTTSAERGDKTVPRTARGKSQTRSPSRSMRAESTTPSFRRREKAWEEFDLSDEDDFDQQITSPGRRKGNSKKALKWLGLLA